MQTVGDAVRPLSVCPLIQNVQAHSQIETEEINYANEIERRVCTLPTIRYNLNIYGSIQWCTYVAHVKRFPCCAQPTSSVAVRLQ